MSPSLFNDIIKFNLLEKINSFYLFIYLFHQLYVWYRGNKIDIIWMKIDKKGI